MNGCPPYLLISLILLGDLVSKGRQDVPDTKPADTGSHGAQIQNNDNRSDLILTQQKLFKADEGGNRSAPRLDRSGQTLDSDRNRSRQEALKKADKDKEGDSESPELQSQPPLSHEPASLQSEGYPSNVREALKNRLVQKRIGFFIHKENTVGTTRKLPQQRFLVPRLKVSVTYVGANRLRGLLLKARTARGRELWKSKTLMRITQFEPRLRIGRPHKLLARLQAGHTWASTRDMWRADKTVSPKTQRQLLKHFLQLQHLQGKAKFHPQPQRLIRRISMSLPVAKQAQIITRNVRLRPGEPQGKKSHVRTVSFWKQKRHKVGLVGLKLLYPGHLESIAVPPESLRLRKFSIVKQRDEKLPWVLYRFISGRSSRQLLPRSDKGPHLTLSKGGKVNRNFNRDDEINDHRQKLLMSLRKSKSLQERLLMQRLALETLKNIMIRKAIRERTEWSPFENAQSRVSPRQNPLSDRQHNSQVSPSWHSPRSFHKQIIDQRLSEAQDTQPNPEHKPSQLDEDQARQNERDQHWLMSQAKRVPFDLHTFHKLLAKANRTMQSRIEQQEKLVQKLRSTMQSLKRQNSGFTVTTMDKLKTLYSVLKSLPSSLSVTDSPFLRILKTGGNVSLEGDTLTDSVGANGSRYLTFRTIRLIFRKKISYSLAVADNIKHIFRLMRNAITKLFTKTTSRASQVFSYLTALARRADMSRRSGADGHQHWPGHRLNEEPNTTDVTVQVQGASRKSSDNMSQAVAVSGQLSDIAADAPSVSHNESEQPGTPLETTSPGLHNTSAVVTTRWQEQPRKSLVDDKRSSTIDGYMDTQSAKKQFVRQFVRLVLKRATKMLIMHFRNLTDSSSSAGLDSSEYTDRVPLAGTSRNAWPSVSTGGNDTVSEHLLNKSSQYNHTEQYGWIDSLVALLNITKELKCNGTQVRQVVRWIFPQPWYSHGLARSILWLSQLPHRLMAFIRRLEVANLTLRMKILSRFLARFDPALARSDRAGDTERHKKMPEVTMRVKVIQWGQKDIRGHENQNQPRVETLTKPGPTNTRAASPRTTTSNHNTTDQHTRPENRNLTLVPPALSPVVKIMNVETDKRSDRNQSFGTSLYHPTVTSAAMKSRSRTESLKYVPLRTTGRKLLGIEPSRTASKPTARAIRKREISGLYDSMSSERLSPSAGVRNHSEDQQDAHSGHTKTTEQNASFSTLSKQNIAFYPATYSDKQTRQLPHTMKWLRKRQDENLRIPAYLKHLLLTRYKPVQSRADSTMEKPLVEPDLGQITRDDQQEVSLSHVNARALRLKLLALLRLLRRHHVYERYGLAGEQKAGSGAGTNQTVEQGRPAEEDTKLDAATSVHMRSSLETALTPQNVSDIHSLEIIHDRPGKILNEAELSEATKEWLARNRGSSFPAGRHPGLKPNTQPNAYGKPTAHPIGFDVRALDFEDNLDDFAHADTGYRITQEDLHKVHPTRDDLELLKQIEMLTYKALGEAGEAASGPHLPEADGDRHTTEGSQPGRHIWPSLGTRAQDGSQMLRSLDSSAPEMKPRMAQKDHSRRTKREPEAEEDDFEFSLDYDFLMKKDLMKDLRRKWVRMKEKIRRLQSQIYESMDKYSEAENDLERLLRRGNALAAADVKITTDNRLVNTMNKADWRVAKGEFKKFRKDIERNQKRNLLLDQRAARKGIFKKLRKLSEAFERRRDEIDMGVSSLLNSTLSLPVIVPGSLGVHEHQTVDDGSSNSDMWDYVGEDGLAHVMNEIGSVTGYDTDVDQDPDLSRVDQMLGKVLLRNTRDVRDIKPADPESHKPRMNENKSDLQNSKTEKQNHVQNLHTNESVESWRTQGADKLLPQKVETLNISSTTSRSSKQNFPRRRARALNLDKDGEVIDDSRFDLTFSTKWKDLKGAVKVLQKNIAEIVGQYSKAEQKVEKLIQLTTGVDNNLYQLTNTNAVNKTIDKLKWEAVRRDFNLFRNQIRQLESMIRNNEITGMAKNLREQIQKIAEFIADQQTIVDSIQHGKADPNMLFTFSMGTRDDLASLDYFDAVRGDPRARVVESTAFHRLWRGPQDYNDDSTTLLDDQLADLNQYEYQVNSLSDLRAVDDQLRQMLMKTAMGPSVTQELNRVKRRTDHPARQGRFRQTKGGADKTLMKNFAKQKNKGNDMADDEDDGGEKNDKQNMAGQGVMIGLPFSDLDLTSGTGIGGRSRKISEQYLQYGGTPDSPELLADGSINLEQELRDLKEVWRADQDMLRQEIKSSRVRDIQDNSLEKNVRGAERDFWYSDEKNSGLHVGRRTPGNKGLHVGRSGHAGLGNATALTSDPFYEDIFNLDMGKDLTSDYPSAEEHVAKEFGRVEKLKGFPKRKDPTSSGRGWKSASLKGRTREAGGSSDLLIDKQVHLKDGTMKLGSEKSFLPTKLKAWNDLNLQDLIYSSEPSEWEMNEFKERDPLDSPSVGAAVSDSLYNRNRKRKLLNLRGEILLSDTKAMSDNGPGGVMQSNQLKSFCNYDRNQLDKKAYKYKDVLADIVSLKRPGKDDNIPAKRPKAVGHLTPEADLSHTDDPSLPLETQSTSELNLQEFYSQNEDLNLNLPRKVDNDADFLQLAEIAQQELENPIEEKNIGKPNLPKLGDLVDDDPILFSFKNEWDLPNLNNVKSQDLRWPSTRRYRGGLKRSTGNLDETDRFEVNKMEPQVPASKTLGHHSAQRVRRQAADESLATAEDVIRDADGSSLVQSLQDEHGLPLSLKLTRDLTDFWAQQKNHMEDERELWLDFDDLATGNNDQVAEAINEAAENTIKSANQPLTYGYYSPELIDYDIDRIRSQLEEGGSKLISPDTPIDSAADDKDLKSFDSLIHMGIDDPNPDPSESNEDSILQILQHPSPETDSKQVHAFAPSDKIYREIKKAETFLNAEIAKERKEEEAVLLKEIKRQEEEEKRQRKKDEKDMQWVAKHEAQAMKELEAVTKELTEKRIKEYRKEVAEIKAAMKDEQKDQARRRKEWQKELAMLKQF